MDIFEVDDLLPEEEALSQCKSDDYYNLERECLKYHYTDLYGLQGILKSGSIWLSDSSSLNDLTEGKLILNHACKTLESMGDFKRLDRLKSLIQMSLSKSYIGSFSRFGNRLSQWRGYANKNSTGGFAIGFNWENLKHPFKPNYIKFYDETSHVTSGLDFVTCRYIRQNDYEPLVNSLLNILSEPSDMRAGLMLGGILFSLKHIGFKEEEEYRALYYWWDDQPIMPESNKPRVELQFYKESVKRIVVGPSINQDNQLHNLQELLTSLDGYANIELYRSTIPYIDK